MNMKNKGEIRGNTHKAKVHYIYSLISQVNTRNAF